MPNQVELEIYRRWYNHVRPYQHLDGRQTRFFFEWEGLLVGFTRY